MNGLGGLNKSANGVGLGMVQLQLPVVKTKADLTAQTARVVELVGKGDIAPYCTAATVGLAYINLGWQSLRSDV